ncbi:MAG: ankyrin repeat domain-containing protein [Verrucomicrobia bacterium]|nr:ankyrin repeat domain-containing protein [Verrucomicrobiota bacterium]
MKTILLAVLCGLMTLGAAFAHDENFSGISHTHISLRGAVLHAIHESDTAFFDLLVKKGYQINLPIDADSGRTALHVAAQSNNLVMIRHLLKAGADPLARDCYDGRPVDVFKYEKEPDPDFAPTVDALKRELTDYDRRKLMGMPVPVWRELLGEPKTPDDPLAPPQPGRPQPALVSFISINDKDPPAEMKSALGAHFPRWRPVSDMEHAAAESPSSYWDKNTKEFGRKVEITFSATTSNSIPPTVNGLFAIYARGKGLPCYECKLRTATGDALRGGGCAYTFVLIAGYWIEVDRVSWDE